MAFAKSEFSVSKTEIGDIFARNTCSDYVGMQSFTEGVNVEQKMQIC